MKATAAILVEPNKPLEICEIEWLPLQYGQVLVKILASGICGAQLQEIRGEKGSHFPRLLGHEACGEVIEVGPCVKTVSVGDRVVCHWRKGDGIESESPRWGLNAGGGVMQQLTAGQITTFSNYSVISENRLTRVPRHTSVELSALLGCGLSTALGTVENDANIRFGERVLILGCGGLGMNLILAARLRQASVVVAADISDKRKEAIMLGADRFVHCETESLSHFNDFSGFDVVIDTTGNPTAISNGITLTASSGRFIMVGQPKPGESVAIQQARDMFNGEGKSIRATQGGSFQPSHDVPRYVAMPGVWDVSRLITHRFPLQSINEALDLVRSGHAGRVLIDYAD